MLNDYKNVYEAIRPSQKETTKLDLVKKKLNEAITESFSDRGLNVKLKTIGSSSTGNFLRYSKDIDGFVGLPDEFNAELFFDGIKNIKSAENLEKKVDNHITGGKANFVFGDYRITLAPIKVPITKIDSLAQDAYFHPDFVSKNLPAASKPDVLLTKSLFGVSGVYGRKVCGFACEQLMTKFKTFERLLETLASDRKIQVDFSNKNLPFEGRIVVTYPYMGTENLCFRLTAEDNAHIQEKANLALTSPKQFYDEVMQWRNQVFWKFRAIKYGLDERLSMPDVYFNRHEVNSLRKLIDVHTSVRVLDAGCGNGLTAMILAEGDKNKYVGVDVNRKLIDCANEILITRPKLRARVDFKTGSLTCLPARDESFDVIITKRSLINLPSWTQQMRAIDEIARVLKSNGSYYAVEAFEDAYSAINGLRKRAGLQEIPLPEHTTLLNRQFFDYTQKHFNLEKIDDISSSYYLLSRVAYAKISDILGRVPSYSSSVNLIAAALPSLGNFGIDKLCSFKRK